MKLQTCYYCFLLAACASFSFIEQITAIEGEQGCKDGWNLLAGQVCFVDCVEGYFNAIGAGSVGCPPNIQEGDNAVVDYDCVAGIIMI